MFRMSAESGIYEELEKYVQKNKTGKGRSHNISQPEPVVFST